MACHDYISYSHVAIYPTVEKYLEASAAVLRVVWGNLCMSSRDSDFAFFHSFLGHDGNFDLASLDDVIVLLFLTV